MTVNFLKTKFTLSLLEQTKAQTRSNVKGPIWRFGVPAVVPVSTHLRAGVVGGWDGSLIAVMTLKEHCSYFQFSFKLYNTVTIHVIHVQRRDNTGTIKV